MWRLSHNAGRHASILVLYDEPASESDGLGWVDAPCCLDYGKGPYKPNLTRAIGEVLDLMANLEELHLDIKQCVTPLPDFFFSDLLTLNYPRRKQYLQLKHLRVLGSALCRSTIEWCPNLFSLDIEVSNPDCLKSLDTLKSLRRLAVTVRKNDHHVFPTFSAPIINGIGQHCPDIEWLILKNHRRNQQHSPPQGSEPFRQVGTSFISLLNQCRVYGTLSGFCPSQAVQLFITGCQRLQKLQRLAVVLAPNILLTLFQPGDPGYDLSLIQRRPDQIHDLVLSPIVFPELRRLPSSVREFCVLTRWPCYWKCQRRGDGSFEDFFKNVFYDKIGPGVWPVGLLHEKST